MMGIYKIENQLDGKCYIGSAQNIHRRRREHLGTYKSNVKLKRAIEKYGIENFNFTILEEVRDKAKLLYYEQIWLDILYQSLDESDIYNLAPTAGSPLGRTHSEETKLKIAATKLGKKRVFSSEWRENIGKSQRGRIRPKKTPEQLLNMANAQRGKKASEATRQKLRDVHARRKSAKEAVNL